MHEFDGVIPDMETIDDVLKYVASRAASLPEGEWITLRQVFITRLREQRYPTRDELDRAAPKHPVVFSTGPDASLNSLALKLCNIDKDFKVDDGGTGFAERDPATGEPTGILRNLGRYIKSKPSGKSPTEDDQIKRHLELFADYNSVGITSIADRSASASAIARYKKLRDEKRLTVRISMSAHVDNVGPIDKLVARIKEIGTHELHESDPMAQIVGIKTFLDGGMLTGSAYMRRPWGLSSIYSITDPEYKGVLFIPPDRLKTMVKAAVESGLQFTAHSVGDGAVHNLIAAYEEVNREIPVRSTRPCITHCNFMSAEAIERMAKLGIVADIQPAWLYLDTRTLTAQFGYDRLRFFQPLRTCFAQNVIVGGGSDHMQKIGSFRSVNPYNPFLGMQTAVTRKARWYDGQLHPEEALTREQALRFYTINNAYVIFREQDVGSIEPGKRADLAVLDQDLLACPEEKIRDTRVLRTYLDGKLVYSPN
jgi:predicted amidohydrolase YtcJ